MRLAERLQVRWVSPELAIAVMRDDVIDLISDAHRAELATLDAPWMGVQMRVAQARPGTAVEATFLLGRALGTGVEGAVSRHY